MLMYPQAISWWQLADRIMLMAQNKYGYIPPSIQRQMDQHLQRMPANLQKYQSGSTYIPSHAAKSMTNYMQKSMPAHMKEYITPYMQQKVTAGLNSLDPATARPMQARAPVPNLMRRDHSGYGEQFTVNMPAKDQSQPHKSLSFAPQYSPNQNNTPLSTPRAPTPGGGNNPYDFILDSKSHKKSILPSGSFKSRLMAVVIGGGLLIIVAVVVIKLIGGAGSGQTSALVDLAEQQNEIARIAAIGEDKAISQTTKNLAFTVDLSIQSDQTNTLALLKKSGHKVSDNQLGLLKSSQTDQTLNNAASSNNFDATFTSLIKSKLQNYRIALQNVFRNSTSASEKQLIQSNFNGASLLVDNQNS